MFTRPSAARRGPAFKMAGGSVICAVVVESPNRKIPKSTVLREMTQFLRQFDFERRSEK